MANYTVSKNLEGGWNITKDNVKRASNIADTQTEAINMARDYSHNSGGGEVRIKGIDNKYREGITVPPGNDPFPPKG